MKSPYTPIYINEAAEILGIGKKTLQNYLRLGKIPKDCYFTNKITKKKIFYKEKILFNI